MNEHDKPDCDCFDPDCEECNQRIADIEDEQLKIDALVIIQNEEEAQLQRELEGGDDDDFDEDDMHGSHPIDDPAP